MAVPCSFSPNISVRSSFSGLRNGCHTRFLMQKDGQVVCKKADNSLQIRCSSRDKVFEDQSVGIICYRDENGEIVCEGYDEGPRLQQQVSRTAFHLSDSEILDLLQKNWLQIANGSGISIDAADAIDIAEELKWNGFY